MAHVNIRKATAKMISDTEVELKWEYDDGNIFTKNTTVVLTRATSGKPATNIVLPKDSFDKKHYIEHLPTFCDEYVYTLAVKPGGSAYEVQNPAVTAQREEGDTVKIVARDYGRIVKVDASKGHFNGHVLLNWQTDGKPIDMFIIQAREQGKNKPFEQIDQVEANGVSNVYSYVDRRALPSVVYEYRIFANMACGSDIISIPSDTVFGFRTPTGEINGRIAFENGQGVPSVEVRVEATDGTGTPTKSFKLGGTDYLEVETNSLLDQDKEVTLQAWVRSDKDGEVIKKDGMYALTIKANKPSWQVGADEISADDAITTDNKFHHLTGVAGKDSLYLYVNGKLKAKAKRSATTLAATNKQLVFGKGLNGYIDEVRVWKKALSADTIALDFDRRIAGDERGLVAYYNFDFATPGRFYDASYSGSSYNTNHGSVFGAVLSDVIPDMTQLSFKAYTDASGTYRIRSLPYIGNGTSYRVVPRLGIHSFASAEEIRLVSTDAASHTINFTDRSSFPVEGKVIYHAGNVPVEGVSFKVDGVTVMDGKGKVVTTDAQGKFLINVPVGRHEVRAEKVGHNFVNDGKITDINGADLNYQDMVTGVVLQDSTYRRFIGRIAGGPIQQKYPVGFSRSTNNLSEGIRMVLTYKSDAYSMYDATVSEEVAHTTSKGNPTQSKSHTTYFKNQITVRPDVKTGEFMVDLIPEKYTISIEAPGHDMSDVKGNTEELDMTQPIIMLEEYDSLSTETVKPTVKYHKKQQFIKRYKPTLDIYQLANGVPMDHFGSDSVAVNELGTGVAKAKTFVDGAYTLGYPVLVQGQLYPMALDVFEEYVYKDENGKDKADRTPERVPTTDAVVSFSGTEAFEVVDSLLNLSVDAKGHKNFYLRAANPDFTTGLSKIAAKFSYGKSGTTIPWAKNDMKAIIHGYKAGANDFITKGPDKVLFVLRDPPGSNSYSYLEKGATISATDTWTGSITNEGSILAYGKGVARFSTFSGLGAGVIATGSTGTSVLIRTNHSEEVVGSISKNYLFETTQRFQTSDDPMYVGANGDTYVGFSTNIGLGKTQNVSVIPRNIYDINPNQFEVFTEVSDLSTNPAYILVKHSSLGINYSAGTMFAYPQIFITDVLIPKIKESIKKDILIAPDGEWKDSKYQEMANAQKKNVYVSYIPADDPDFGKSNADVTIDSRHHSNGDPKNLFDGPSYKVFAPTSKANVAVEENSPLEDLTKVLANDTIAQLWRDITMWEARIYDNEKAKAEATVDQNYSFHAGASIERSRAYTQTTTNVGSVNLSLGVVISDQTVQTINGIGVENQIEEVFKTTHGGEFSREFAGTVNTGFVLADNGDDDYISVDVCRESGFDEDKIRENSYDRDKINSEDIALSTYIFRTKGGATSCPHEAGYVTKYYKPGTVIDARTVQLEKPEISVEKSFIQNVPSGKSAYFTLYLRNTSEAKEDGWYDLKIVDGSNPDGAQLVMDGAPIGNGRSLLVPAGETLVKTLEVRKGRVMNYDDIKLVLASQCQCDPTDFADDIVDTVAITVHYTPSATAVRIKKPGKNWTYNTKLPTKVVNGLMKHYMEVQLDQFDVNYDNFHRIMLQYKPKSGGENDWITLMSYYADEELYKRARGDEKNPNPSVAWINPEDAGTITYPWFLDDMPDQEYELRAVGTSMINNEEILNISETYPGVKDMYTPRLFGAAQPADGVLDVNDEILVRFNEKIAEGYLTDNNFQVTGIRNGAITDHSTSVVLDGNDALEAEFSRNWTARDLTIETWMMPDALKDQTIFSQGNINEAIEMTLTADKHLKVRVGAKDKVFTSPNTVAYEDANWAHVAMTLSKDGKLTAYYNFVPVIFDQPTAPYQGEGSYRFGADVEGNNHFAGKMHGARIWDVVRSSGKIQVESLNQLSGVEPHLLAYYPMDEGRGEVLLDKARGVNLNAKGTTWALPEGRSLVLNGQDQYATIPTGAAVITPDMDFTIELWFRGDSIQKDATLLSTGKGDLTDYLSPERVFNLGFENGLLGFTHNGKRYEAMGNYLDNNWHHVAVAVSRSAGRGQIYVDGKLNNFFSADEVKELAADKMYVGARGYLKQEGSLEKMTDRYFKGSVDEIRLWNLYKTEELTQSTNNIQTDGSTKGLLAYYNFQEYQEHIGLQNLVFSLKDAKQYDSTTPTPVATLYGANTAEMESKLTAPVKNRGPVSKLLYDFVVNNDAVVINLKEPLNRIEKTIVTFTIDNVTDMNGNKMASPITWTAYINKNQLRWSETAIDLTQPYLTESKFTVKAVNKGGTITNYTVENLPAWLEAKPAAGTLDPLASKDIAFTVNEGLNVGSYDAIVSLRGDNGVVETLPISVKVLGERPDWSVNPSDFEYSMTVTGKLRFNGIFSNDTEDLLAAFHKGKCIGVAKGTYNKNHDMVYTFLTVYNNETKAENIEFRAWDASTGKVFSAMANTDIVFGNGLNYGNAAEPVIFDCKEMIFTDIPLNEGWTWVSFNVTSSDLDDVDKTLANGLWTDGDVVKSSRAMASFSPSTNLWKGTMAAGTAFDNKSMFMIRSSRAQILSVGGNAVDVANTNIPVEQGWNYIAYLPQTTYTVTEALAGYDATVGDVIKSQTAFATFSGHDWVGSLTYMQPNKGYMLYRQGGGTTSFHYPATSGVLALAPESVELTPEENARYAENMTILAQATGVEEGDEIEVYAGGERCAKACPVNVGGETLHFVNVSGDTNGKALRFVLRRNGEAVAEATTRSAYKSNATIGALHAPLALHFGQGTAQTEVYPSPFKTDLHIDVNVEKSSPVSIVIYNASSKAVWGQTATKESGWQSFTWNGHSPQGEPCAAGVYIVKITVNGQTFTHKVIKL